ncbi:outer membrane lipoprotein-sorting protein [Teredinibacter turnerae]|uniref:outer membrane lipoprotein-sorting protein n=1 Tax=Teredinibacter turnerae TaxID=2426 RepID=UPI0004279C6A|nr:outer membrane lipoprotein-sorting protein [Teredinibacter turnerae]
MQYTNTLKSYFNFILRHPRIIIGASFLTIACLALLIPGIYKDTSADAFISETNPALVYRNKVKEIFGLEDPFIIAVSAKNSVFNASSLQLIDQITNQVKDIKGIDPEQVRSLATEKGISGNEEGMDVYKFWEDQPPTTDIEIQNVQQSVNNVNFFSGTLISADQSTALIIAEALDNADKSAIYRQIMAIKAELKNNFENEQIYVAGEGAAGGYLGDYIDQDMMKLNPLSGFVITLILFIAFRTWRGVLLPNVVIVAAVAASVGIMAAFSIPFYIITNGLLVILIGISVADSIHILNVYYHLAQNGSYKEHNSLIIDTMLVVFRPITLTTLTTIAGFSGLYFASSMPPMKYFGLFAIVGVFFAWLYSVIFFPVALSMLGKKGAAALAQTRAYRQSGYFSHIATQLGRVAVSRPLAVLLGASIVFLLGVYGATQIIVEDQRITNFNRNENLYIADKEINKKMAGIYTIDIVVEATGEEGLLRPDSLRQMEDLQRYAESLPHVNQSVSVVDYIKQMNKAVKEGRSEEFRIPEDQNLVSQLFFLYSISGDPTDFEQEVGYDYKTGLVRLYVDKGSHLVNKELVANLQDYIDTEFDNERIKGTLTGRLILDYHWIKNVAREHMIGSVVSIVLVWLMACILFRSIAAAFLTLVPVIFGLTTVYMIMGFAGIWLGVGTSMFASIAIGLGIDFGIHIIDRIRSEVTRGHALKAAVEIVFPETGRALIFNFLAIAAGFLVLTISDVPPLVNFGLLVAVAVSASFFASMLLIPALIQLIQPKFIENEQEGIRMGKAAVSAKSLAIFAAIILITGSGYSPHAKADENIATEGESANSIVSAVNNRDIGQFVSRNITMRLVDRNGGERIRETRSFRKYFGDERRTVIFFDSPESIKGTAFLTYDYEPTDKEDDQWLYLPGLRKVKRVPGAERGDYFLGTDFTYDDIKNENKIVEDDYTFEITGQEKLDEHEVVIVRGIPVSKKVSKETGYGRLEWYIDKQINMPRKIDAWDINGNKLKTINILDIKKINNIYTSLEMSVNNHKTGHKTYFLFKDVDYQKSVPNRVFDKHTFMRSLF